MIELVALGALLSLVLVAGRSVRAASRCRVTRRDGGRRR
jgi:hypothetical protein